MKTTTKHPFQPGDRIRLKWGDQRRPVFRIRGITTRFYSALPDDYSQVYVVRETFTNLTAGAHGLRLAGIHGILRYPRAHEWGFSADLFELVHRPKDPNPPAPAPLDETVVLIVPMTTEAARMLEHLHLDRWVGHICQIDPEEEPAALAARWTKKAPRNGIGSPPKASQERVAKAIANGDEQDVAVPLDPFTLDNLTTLATAAGVEPVTWLQGLLGVLAGKVRRALDLDRKEQGSRAKKPGKNLPP